MIHFDLRINGKSRLQQDVDYDHLQMGLQAVARVLPDLRKAGSVHLVMTTADNLSYVARLA